MTRLSARLVAVRRVLKRQRQRQPIHIRVPVTKAILNAYFWRALRLNADWVERTLAQIELPQGQGPWRH